ncbi:MAG: methylenetetrahydrofolate--tRNA-(uracil(54)-C(5))-methyltransferase (FADH(2)-oxidizing) TrmFO [Rickettsiaceae bacterium]|nr:methylenetetrahydrofolate--tRNA-(uracil(54)-C(5))-methyltransferase (FADH(2)-oxidizing) TrmFO [Rickettsiaceae bacterium]
MRELNIVGGGLAGCEAAWQAANKGVKVNLYEMRKEDNYTNAHSTDKLAELVCSNSFRNDDQTSAIGLLHEEMRRLNSIIMKAADHTKIPAGSALAMDRDMFADLVTKYIYEHPNIKVFREEIKELPLSGEWIIATGPLTSDSLSNSIIKMTGQDQLAFFDAIAPIIYKESINFEIAWFQSRYNKQGPGGDGKDYINCPMNKEQYYNFVNALLEGDKTEFKEWEKDTPYFNGCLPIEVMAERGKETLRFGPMKPVGLENPNNQVERPYAVVQLRQDNVLGSLYNIVGFQTKLKYGAQKAIFSTIPGLENAEFARFGGIHRNSFINSPNLLSTKLELKAQPNIHFAGQVTGVEGYVESAAIGLLAGLFCTAKIKEQEITLPPHDTAIGSLLAHITTAEHSNNFQPMNINFGLMPPLEQKIKNKAEKGAMINARALESLNNWKNHL